MEGAIPVTSAQFGRAALAALEAAAVPFVVLHREGDIARGMVSSDIDIAVAVQPMDVVAQASGQFVSAGLTPVAIWPYDVAHVASVFLMTPTASDGVQLDITYDPSGRGKYGLRTPALLEASAPGEMFPVLDTVDELLYLLRKRRVKRDATRAERLVTRARELPRSVVAARARVVFSPRVAGDVMKMVDRSSPSTRPPLPRWYRLRQAQRLTQRVARPIGFWVHVDGGDEGRWLAEELRPRFGRLLIRSGAGRVPTGPARVGWYVREVLPVRLRAGLYLSWGSSPTHGPDPDLTLQTISDVEASSAHIVRAMAQRLRPASRPAGGS